MQVRAAGEFRVVLGHRQCVVIAGLGAHHNRRRHQRRSPAPGAPGGLAPMLSLDFSIPIRSTLDGAVAGGGAGAGLRSPLYASIVQAGSRRATGSGGQALSRARHLGACGATSRGLERVVGPRSRRRRAASSFGHQPPSGVRGRFPRRRVRLQQRRLPGPLDRRRRVQERRRHGELRPRRGPSETRPAPRPASWWTTTRCWLDLFAGSQWLCENLGGTGQFRFTRRASGSTAIFITKPSWADYDLDGYGRRSCGGPAIPQPRARDSKTSPRRRVADPAGLAGPQVRSDDDDDPDLFIAGDDLVGDQRTSTSLRERGGVCRARRGGASNTGLVGRGVGRPTRTATWTSSW